MPTTVTFEHYEVMTRDDGSLCELGRGAMGITYKGFDTRLRVPVALKVINAAHLHSETARQRFVREARSAARLRHRNVASVFHLGLEDGNYFYAMEFIDGETVDSRVKKHGALAPSLALQIAAQVARALNAAQTHELVHRDIKPANLMLVREDDELVVKVIDFGLAKVALGGGGEDAATLTMSGFLGTPHFASPEQLEEREIDVRSDIYSLGVTLWFALAGKTPFTGSVMQVMSQHITRPPPFEQLEHVPAPVVELLRRMLDKDPAHRPQTALELRKEIERCLAQIGESAAPASDTAFAESGEAAPASETDETQFETGAAVGTRYIITEHVGETESGRVFRAHDSVENRDVRLLALDRELLRDSEAIAQIEQDAAKLTALAHPNVLGVFGVENDGRSACLTLEWIDGFSWRDLLRARRELSLAEVLQILPQAAAGIDAALAARTGRLNVSLPQMFVHFPDCETSPENLLRRPIETWPAFAVKFNALAISRDRFSLTWAGGQTIVGGPRDAGGDARIVREFGVVVYELLGGAPAAVGPKRYTPIASVGEAGNEILRRAIVVPESFASAADFTQLFSAPPKTVPAPAFRAAAETATPVPSETAIPLDAAPAPIQKPAPLPPAAPPQPAPASVSPPDPPRIVLPKPAPAKEPAAPAPRKVEPPRAPRPRRPVLPYVGIGAVLAAAAVAAVQYFRTHPEPRSLPIPPTPVKLTSVPTPVPPTPQPPPKATRQELANAERSKADALEAGQEIRESLVVWLGLMRDFKEFPIGKNGLEEIIGRLRKRPGGLPREEFDALRDEITKAAQLDVLEAMLLLGEQLQKTDPATSFAWFCAAAEKGDTLAMTQAGLMILSGDGTARDDAAAIYYLTKASDQGNRMATAALAECHLNGLGVTKDEKRGMELLRQAADKGDSRAQTTLGDRLHKGIGVPVDDEEAFRLFSLAAERGNTVAIRNLGALYDAGAGVRRSEKKAAEKFKEASLMGDPLSMLYYAVCLETGRGVDRNLTEAKKWYKNAAEAGVTKAAEWCMTNGVKFEPPKK